MATSRAFNPAAVKRQPIRLFGKDYKVKRATQSVMARLDELESELREQPDADDGNPLDAEVGILSAMLEETLDDADGLSDIVMDRWKANDLTMQTLVQSVAFVSKELRGGVELGNA
jgi:hypothetical protein